MAYLEWCQKTSSPSPGRQEGDVAIVTEGRARVKESVEVSEALFKGHDTVADQ